MAYSIRYASFGTVSHATLRSEDLLDAFATELDYQLKRQVKRFPRKAHRKLIREANAIVNATSREEEWASELVSDLQDALNDFAPPYAYFGTTEGDGSDFGYWISADSIEDNFDGLKVDDTSAVPPDYRGEVLHVNNHGNMTLYVAASHGKLREIWAVV